MCSASSNDYSAEPSDLIARFEQLHTMVESEFEVEEGFVEHDIPTFHVKLRENSKEAFLRLIKCMDPIGLIPVLRRRDEKVVLRVIPKPPTKPSRSATNVVLLLATLGTVFLAGFLQSPDFAGAVMFTGAIMAILGSHEMGHKLLADKHDIEATYPYFIPGPPPIGTFGAVIRQKSLPPNKDALFDLGFTGPVTGFIVSIIITLIGVQLSVLIPSEDVPTGAWFIPVPILFRLVTMAFPPSGTGDVIMLHPVAFAGWVGMVITMLNLVPTGMFDGGHVVRSIVGKRAHKILSYMGILLFVIIYYPMAFLALFFSYYEHPGPLDDVSKLTIRRKLAALGLVAIFVLSVVPLFPIWTFF